jgi:general secretion pathway protein A
MYTSFFGLEEKPFSIAPNPVYLFMSDRHREALNHLTYGLGDTGGFVLLTGEVGTGKTTLSRHLMANLPENTQAAFILNPTLSSQELLATLCDELKIRHLKAGATLKSLTDKIQQKLLKNHSEDINTLLIIDEAQHLQPEVLEQLRLLTNLETDTKKLLQVILIGQPELQQLLQRQDLRQLAQRITARYHLLPLSRQEVEQYLKHRLSVAKCFRNIFDKSAVSSIHKVCKGIPRLMNLLADRSLMNAYRSNNAVVNRKIVLQAAHDALGDKFQVKPWWQNSWTKAGGLITALGLTLALGVWWGAYQPQAKVSNTNVENDLTEATTKTVSNQAALTDDKGDTQQDIASESTLADAKITVPKIVQKPELKPKKVTGENFVVKAEAGVSDELLASFQSAIEDTKQGDHSRKNVVAGSSELTPLAQMPTWVQEGVPSLEFEMHLYASDGQGWVRVNGRDRYEGDYISRELLLNEILPQRVVLSFRGEIFTMSALSTWN